MNRIINYTIVENKPLTANVYKMVLKGDGSWVKHPGQFINITIDGKFLKRPLSLCDYTSDSLTIIYKVVGEGTAWLKQLTENEEIEALVDLGNGFQLKENKEAILLVGGGVGVPPLYGLAKQLRKEKLKVTVILGFNTKSEIFYEQEFLDLGCSVHVCTVDGSKSIQGYVSDVMKQEHLEDLYYCTCGPQAMLKAVYKTSHTQGLLSFEERMGCGFGACMGCSCETVSGYKRICVEGPVMESEDLLWTKD